MANVGDKKSWQEFHDYSDTPPMQVVNGTLDEYVLFNTQTGIHEHWMLGPDSDYYLQESSVNHPFR